MQKERKFGFKTIASQIGFFYGSISILMLFALAIVASLSSFESWTVIFQEMMIGSIAELGLYVSMKAIDKMDEKKE